ncbi:MAG: glycosyltransferase family 4 protein [Verrucomicrobiota bacterium]
MIKIGFFSPYGLSGFSGVNAALHKHLSGEGCQCDLISPPPPWRANLVKRIFYKATRQLNGLQYLWEKGVSRCRYYSRHIDQSLADGNYDAVLITGTENCSFCKTNVPLYSYGDSFFGSRVDLYPDQVLAKIHPRSIHEGIHVQQLALHRLRRIYISFQWAVERAKKFYAYQGLEKIEAVGIGANLYQDTGIVKNTSDNENLGLLWIGADWQRKGGDLAVETAIALRNMGIQVKLNLVGASHPVPDGTWIKHHGFLDPQNGEHRKRLFDIFFESSVLLLPTKADLGSLATLDAFALGCVPAASPMGSIPEIIVNDVNGWLIAPYSAHEWAKVIARNVRNSKTMKEMVERNQLLFKTKWNWFNVCQKIRNGIREDIAMRK